MRIQDLLGTSFSNLWRRKLRTLLTILAVVIGATLIGLMVSLSNGVQTFILDQFGLFVPEDSLFVSTGQNLNFIGSGSQAGQPRLVTGPQSSSLEPLTSQDVNQIRSTPGVRQVDYFITVQADSIRRAPDSAAYTVLVSSVPDYQLRLRKLVDGDYFSPESTGQCILPFEYVELFGWADTGSALGNQIIIEVGKLNPFDLQTAQFYLTVAGISQNTVNSTVVLVTASDAISMARFYLDDPDLYSEAQPGLVLQVRAESESAVPHVAQSIRDQGLAVVTAGDILARINNVFNTIQIGLIAFGIVALVVAAIGIINTLLMSVYERTHEVGIMKAVGAARTVIRSLFTIEGAFIGLIGGLLGSILAWIIGLLVNFAGSYTFLSDFPSFSLMVFPLWLAPAIITLTTIISLASALYPASRAAALDPVAALRYE